MHRGYIKLWRKIEDWEWYTDANTIRLFLHLLLKANFASKTWQGVEIKEGQVLTGRKTLAKELCIGEQSVRTSLTRLKSTNEITIKTTNKFSLITIIKWKDYQPDNQLANQRLTSNQPATNQQLTTTYNDKNVKNVKNEEREGTSLRFVPPSLEEIKGYCTERGNQIEAERFIDFYASKGWLIGKNKMKDWKAAIRTWEQRDKIENPNSIKVI